MSTPTKTDAVAPVTVAEDLASMSTHAVDVERDSDVPISTQIYWQLAYQIDSGRLQTGERLAPVRELGAALRVNPNTIRAVYPASPTPATSRAGTARAPWSPIGPRIAAGPRRSRGSSRRC